MADKRINVVKRTGETVSVPEASLPEVLKKGGHVETTDEEQKRFQHEEYGNSPLVGAFLGAADTLTLGGSSALARAVGTEDVLRGVKQENPGPYMAGGVLAAITPLGGPALLGKAGKAVEAGVGATRVGQGAGMLSRVAPRALGTAVEGAGFGASQGFSHSMLSEDKLSPEMVLGHVGSGALLGGALGLGLGAGGALVTDAASSLATSARKFADEASSSGAISEDVLATIAKTPQGSGKAVRAAKADKAKLSDELTDTQAQGAEASLAETEAQAATAKAIPKFKSEYESLDSLTRQARKQAEKELDAGKAAGVKPEDTAVYQSLKRLEEARAETSKHFSIEVGEAVGKGKKPITWKMDDDAIVSALRKPEVNAAFKAQEEARLTLLRTLRPDTEYATRMGTAADDVAAHAETRLAAAGAKVDVAKLADLEKRIADFDSFIKRGSDPFEMAGKKVASAEAAGFKATTEDLKAYVAAQGKVVPDTIPAGSSLELQLKADFYQAAAQSKLQAISKAGAQAQRVGTALGQSAGATVGGAIGGWPGFAIGAVVGKSVGPKLGQLARKLWVHRDVVARKVADGLDAFVKGKRVTVGPASVVASRAVYGDSKVKGSRREQVQQRALQVTQAASDPKTRLVINERLSGVRAVDPMMADKMETLAAQRIAFLASKAPKPPPLKAPFRKTPWHASDADLDKFERFEAAAEEGIGRLVEELAAGRLSPETVETVKTIYPENFAAVQRQLVERAAQIKAELPYQKRLLLGLVFEIPTDESLEEPRLKALQESFQTAHQHSMEANAVSKNDLGSAPKPKRGMGSDPTPAQKLSA